MSIDKIICVGKNYLDHAKELGDVVPEKPVLFLKPASVLKQVSGWGEQIHLDFHFADTAVQPGADMMMPPKDLIVYISQFFPLKSGDIIYTGTPAGVTSISKNTTAEPRWQNHCYTVKWE